MSLAWHDILYLQIKIRGYSANLGTDSGPVALRVEKTLYYISALEN